MSIYHCDWVDRSPDKTIALPELVAEIKDVTHERDYKHLSTRELARLRGMDDRARLAYLKEYIEVSCENVHYHFLSEGRVGVESWVKMPR